MGQLNFARLQAVIQNMSAGVCSADAERRILWSNAAFTRITGYELDEIRGQRPLDFLVDASADPLVIAGLRDKLARHQHIEVELPLRCRDSALRWVHMTVQPIFDDAGTCTEYVAVISDFTQQRAAEAALRASEMRLRSMVEHAPMGIMLTRAAGEITYANAALLRMCGLTLEAARASGSLLTLHPDDRERLAREWRKHRGRGLPFPATGRYLRPDGSVVWWESTTAPIVVDGDLSAHVVMVQDVSERLALEREITEIAGREQHRVGMELHDGLGQELTGLAISLESLSRRATAAGNPLERDLRELTALTSQSVALCREIAQGLAPMQLAMGGLRNALRALVISARSLYGIEVSCSVRGLGAKELPSNAAHQLYRIAQEAISNAVRHGAARSVTMRVRRSGDRLELSIADDGLGMPEGPATDGMGLHTMRYRAKMIGADFDLELGEQGGVRVVCSLRLPPRRSCGIKEGRRSITRIGTGPARRRGDRAGA